MCSVFEAADVESYEELFEIARELEAAAAFGSGTDVIEPMDALERAANEIKRSFSGSWLGYHSRVYYDSLEPPPPGANFSQEWGLKDLRLTRLGSRGAWREFDPQEVKDHIFRLAGDPNLDSAKDAARKATGLFDRCKGAIESIVEDEPDSFITKLKGDLNCLTPLSAHAVAEIWSPKGQIITRDTLAIGQGSQTPPHVDVLATVVSYRHSFEICETAAQISRKAASHLQRRRQKEIRTGSIGTNVFIGHGRSPLWREIKDFVQDRLQLPWDEFNRVPVAGVTNIARLSEMLDAAAIAILVMTAEDEMADGNIEARMNVVHEAGLFQGRLSFTKAIVLLEEGCAEFSNIQGLGQIRFPKGNISATFEEVRRVMEREGLIGDAH
jgi:predicted nucleotide-binding protein